MRHFMAIAVSAVLVSMLAACGPYVGPTQRAKQRAAHEQSQAQSCLAEHKLYAARLESTGKTGIGFKYCYDSLNNLHYVTTQTETRRMTQAEYEAQQAARFEDRTFLFHGRDHGYQVEYFAQGGVLYLWYPGNRRVLPGEWRLDGHKICFRYATSAGNPVTKSPGGAWECTLSEILLIEAKRKPGDIYDLASGNLPYVLDRETKPEGF